MTGVEILATEEVAVGFAFNWLALFITFGAVLVVFVLFGIHMSLKHNNLQHILVGVIVGTIMGILFGVAMGSGLEIPTLYENYYKVTISDEVKMNEFLEKYEIIDQEGKIYTVRERD